MNSIWITENFPPSQGGVQKYMYNTVVHLSLIRSHIITMSIPGGNYSASDALLLTKGDKVIRVDYIPRNIGVLTLFKSFFSLVRTCTLICCLGKQNKISLIVFGHASFFNLYLNLILKWLLNVRRAIIFHGEDIPTVRLKSTPFHRWLVKRTDIAICNSSFTQKRLRDFCGEREKVFISYPGVEENFFETVDSEYVRERFGATNRRVIYTVGRLDRRKGHELVIRALPKVIERFPDVIYLIGGTGKHSEILTTLVDELNLSSHVRFCGFISEEDIVAFHQMGEIFVMPNRILEDGDTEGFGIVFLEAGACGKPVIGGACGGALDAIEDGYSGYLVDPYDANELAEKLLYLLSHPEEAKRLGSNGRQRAGERFRWPYLVARLENYLKKSIPQQNA